MSFRGLTLDGTGGGTITATLDVRRELATRILGLTHVSIRVLTRVSIQGHISTPDSGNLAAN